MNSWPLMLLPLFGAFLPLATAESMPPETVPPETVPPETMPPETMPPEAARNVARLHLARSIRAFAAGSLANSTCLVRSGRLSQAQANQAMAIALREMAITSEVLNNPQVRKAADLLGPKLDETCRLDALDREQARRLVSDEL